MGLQALPVLLLFEGSIWAAVFFEKRWAAQGVLPASRSAEMTYPEDRAARPPRGDGAGRDAARDRAPQRLRRCRRTRSRGSRELYEFRDFEHFIEVWVLTTNALRTRDDFRQVVVDYAAEAACARRGLHRGHLLAGRARPPRRRAGTTSSAATATAREEAREVHGVEVRLTPDIVRGFPLEEARAGRSLLGGVRATGASSASVSAGSRRSTRRSPTRRCSRLAKAEGLGSVPHAGEVAGPESVRGALDALQADRHPPRLPRSRGPGARRGARRRGDRARRLARLERAHRRGAVPRRSIRCHASWRPACRCSISTDDPAMFDTDLTREYEAARSIGVDPRAAFEAGIDGRALRRGDPRTPANDPRRLRLGPDLRTRASLGTWPDPARNVERPPQNAHSGGARAHGPLPAPNTADVEGDDVLPQAAPPGQVDVRLPRARVRASASSASASAAAGSESATSSRATARPRAARPSERRPGQDREGRPRGLQGAGRRATGTRARPTTRSPRMSST